MTSDKPLHSVSVAAAIVRDDGRILAIRRRDNNHWEPPGGVLEIDESIEDGLRREVREETGLDIEPERLSGIYKNMRRGIVALVFRCRPAGGDLATSAETRDLRWVEADEVSELMDEAYAIRILDALSPGPVTVRSHDGTHVEQPTP